MELRPLVCQDSPREQLQQKLNLKYFLFTMEDMSTRSGNKLTEEQIEHLIKRLRGVEHIEPIVTIEDSNVNNETMALEPTALYISTLVSQ
jgi:recombinational DNA repair protein RecR